MLAPEFTEGSNVAMSRSAVRVSVTRFLVLLVLAGVSLLAAACGSGSGSGSAASTSTSASTTSTTASGGVQAPAGASTYYEVKTGTVRGLGTVLVNGQGLTLYMFRPDDERGRSTCYGKCASGWPPLRLPTGVTVPVAGGRAEASLLGTTARKDGGLQVTYTQPGQATGQGIDSLGGYWYVLSPDGQVVKAKG